MLSAVTFPVVQWLRQSRDGVRPRIFPQREYALRPAVGIGGCTAFSKRPSASSYGERHRDSFKH